MFPLDELKTSGEIDKQSYTENENLNFLGGTQ
jgi:hypothetical protein